MSKQLSSFEQVPYVGRYAPSPTGVLHLGNLRTALLAWLHAKLHGGRFLVRMEDLDQPRVVEGSAAQILLDLEWLGITWDGEVLFQSDRYEVYQDAMRLLGDLSLVYPCFCSRKEIREAASAPHGETPLYPGFCRSLSEAEREQKAALKAPAYRVNTQDSAWAKSDFIVQRADGIYAYHLAVTVDDLDQGVTDVVRGADLINSVSEQRQLAAWLAPAQATINYQHVRLMMDSLGHRMSKRDGSRSAMQWRSEGRVAEQLIAKFAYSLGWIDCEEPLSADELLGIITLSDWESAIAEK
ncbi:MAG: tRNA glutamyl-Q(34) synthetase GluQRS [Pseudomonadota bacterium]